MSWYAIIAKGATDTANNFGPQISGEKDRHLAANILDPAGVFPVGWSDDSSGGQFNFEPVFKQGNQFLKYLFGDEQATGFVKGLEKGKYAGGLFGPETRDAIRNYMNGTTFGAGGPNLLSMILGSPADYSANLNRTMGLFDESIATAREANETGLLTDGTAYFNEAIRKLQTDIIPQLSEVSGLGVQSGGFADNVSRESANLLGQASLANIDLAEAAANRRLSASPLLSTLATTRQALPLNIATQLSALFGEEQSRPFDMFQKIFSMGNSQLFGTPSYNPYDPTAGYASAATGLAGILGALGDFDFGGGGGGGVGTDPSAHPNS